MIRKSLVVFVVCASLALAISLFAAGDTPTGPNFPQPLSWTRTWLREAGCRRGGQSRRYRWRENWVLEGIGGLRFKFQIKRSAGQSLPSRPVEEAQLPFCDGTEAPPAKCGLSCSSAGRRRFRCFDGGQRVEAEAVPEPACRGALYDGGNKSGLHASRNRWVSGRLRRPRAPRSSWRGWKRWRTAIPISSS